MPQITVEITEIEQRVLSYHFPDIKDMLENWLQNHAHHFLVEINGQVSNHALTNNRSVPQNQNEVLDYFEKMNNELTENE